MAYAIVEFTGYNSLDIIPIGWFVSDEEDKCYWPSHLAKARVGKMIVAKAEKDEKWNTFKIRVLGKAGNHVIS